MGNEKFVSRIGFVDLCADNPQRILRISEKPVLDIGEPGSFDDNGVVPIQLLKHDGRLMLIYVGFQLGTQIPYTLFPGIAYSDDGGSTFYREKTVPFLDRIQKERFIRTAPHLIYENGKWKIWYLGGDDWIVVNGNRKPVYRLFCLETDSLERTNERGRLVFDISEEIHGYGRPILRKSLSGGWDMFYSSRYRDHGYKLEWAHSVDRENWMHLGELPGFNHQRAAWESDMTCFGHPLTVGKQEYLFYNGNNYGRSGFGWAERINE